ncbi:MAG TPA: TRAP transporter substrate-binding protein DctP [Candidatus Bathyarchaeia archaeon]|nr:TRAP transporter substrate-binding protein DctP [Candidatus Bathyarchaeia archaeon]
MNSFWNKAAGFTALLFLFSFRAAYGGPTIIKMATIAPEGSSWHRVLLDMGEEWKRISGGKVKLRIYPGGVVGDEEAMLRKMRVGQLQAAAISGLGLTFLDRSFYALHVPMMFASEEEFDYARSKLSPKLEKILEEKGFIVLNWGDAGWVRFFAKDPFTHPSEMKPMKLYLGAGDAMLTQLYKEAGFRPVPISIVDMLPSLQTGLVEAFNAVPLAALAFQWFALAPNMADLNWSFLSGATVIDKRAWMKIPEELRPKILKVSRDASKRLRREIRTLNENAVKAMVENGLKVNHISSSVEAEWRKLVEDIYPQIRGKIVPADVFDEVRMYRDEFRSSSGHGRAMTR